MCTLIIGRDVLGAGTVLVAANRDELASRPSDPPGTLNESPRVVGGRDRVAGGTWLALREGEALVALLNRWRAGAGDPASLRSRGLLTLDVATASPSSAAEGPAPEAAGRDPLATAALRRAAASAAAERYAPFSLVFASPRASWLLAWTGEGAARAVAITPGWHVLTHRELDDPHEPRAAHLVRRLAALHPAGLEAAAAGLGALLRSHGEDGTPPVCLHDAPVVTVSSSMIWLADGERRYWHAEGPPCRNEYQDHSGLVAAAGRGGSR